MPYSPFLPILHVTVTVAALLAAATSGCSVPSRSRIQKWFCLGEPPGRVSVQCGIPFSASYSCTNHCSCPAGWVHFSVVGCPQYLAWEANKAHKQTRHTGVFLWEKNLVLPGGGTEKVSLQYCTPSSAVCHIIATAAALLAVATSGLLSALTIFASEGSAAP